mmetsp:Transcript_7258/g.15792  ORF Transcript_7258/g.15792 Transcript_7258/m.15792 type:complete len:783 (+) Transcript_7258:2090-4438(+)
MTEPSVGMGSPVAASTGPIDEASLSDAEPIAEMPSTVGESKSGDTPQAHSNDVEATEKSSKETEQIVDEGMTEQSVGLGSPAVASTESHGEAKLDNVKPLFEVPFPEQDKMDSLPQQDTKVMGQVNKETDKKEAGDEDMTNPVAAPKEDSSDATTPPNTEAEVEIRAIPDAVALNQLGDETQRRRYADEDFDGMELPDLSKTTNSGAMPAVANPAFETPGLFSSPASKEDDDEVKGNDEKSSDRGPLGEEKQESSDSSSDEAGGVTVQLKGYASEFDSDSSTSSEDEPRQPPPVELPLTGVVSLRGTLANSGGVHKITGVWALGLDIIESNRDLCLDFEYEHNSTGESNEFPSSGKYSGWFHLNSDDDLSKVKSPEKDVDLKFIKNSEGYHNVEGSGSNVYGFYSITGTLSADGVITMCRKFEEKPKPKRTKKMASRRRRTPFTAKKKRNSKSGTPEKVSPTKKKRKSMIASHPDSGKRYGIGKPGLLCDCCFFEEHGDVSQTPFIKCLYCGLVAHSACYPPISTVDEKGKFLCDVCTSYFHPSVNREERTKKSEDGNMRTPKPLAEDIEAKGDGRVHRRGVYCQLCARSDVLGGMKPTDSNSWVHLACLMSTEDAFFQNKTAVHVKGALKKNRTEVMKCPKSKQKCEECGGRSGLLLKCKHKGCDRHMHALCAEILDRLRVVENNGERDIISYKCTLHSYEGVDACGVCKLSNKQHEMLECDKCSQGYHMACLTPPLTEIPEGDWFCARCTTKEPAADIPTTPSSVIKRIHLYCKRNPDEN